MVEVLLVRIPGTGLCGIVESWWRQAPLQRAALLKGSQVLAMLPLASARQELASRRSLSAPPN